MKEEDILPDGWTILESDDRSSTVAWFVRGWESPDGKEILVWHGVEHEGEIHLELPSSADPPEDTEYVIEVLKDGELQAMKFAEKKGEAINRGLQQAIIEKGNDTL